MDMDMMMWNIVLTAILGLIGWFATSIHKEQHRLSVLLNKTREEIVQCQLNIAEKYARKDETAANFERIVDRLDALDAKLDRFLEM
jgi:uncharacterized membrane protein